MLLLLQIIVFYILMLTMRMSLNLPHLLKLDKKYPLKIRIALQLFPWLIHYKRLTQDTIIPTLFPAYRYFHFKNNFSDIGRYSYQNTDYCSEAIHTHLCLTPAIKPRVLTEQIVSRGAIDLTKHERLLKPEFMELAVDDMASFLTLVMKTQADPEFCRQARLEAA